MPYYKNNQDFMQPLTIDGKRYVVKPKHIVHLDKEIDTDIYSFLEKIDTPNDESLIQDIQPLKSRNKAKSISANELNAIKEEIVELKHIVSQKTNRGDMTAIINETLRKTPQMEPAEFNELIECVKKHQDTLDDLENVDILKKYDTLIRELQDNNVLIFKRLEILKKAFQNIETMFYESEEIVDEEIIVINEDS